MSARSVWVDYQKKDDSTLLGKYGITSPYFDVRQLEAMGPDAALSFLKSVRNKYQDNPGVYLCTPELWPGVAPTSDPLGWADWASKLVQQKVAPGTGGDFPRVDINYEGDKPAWLLAMLKRWRSHQPHRTTFWSVQAHKASIYASIATDLAALNITVRPECYQGNDSDTGYQRVESSEEVLAWSALGLKVEPFLDAKQLGAWWTGVAFIQSRLP